MLALPKTEANPKSLLVKFLGDLDPHGPHWFKVILAVVIVL